MDQPPDNISDVDSIQSLDTARMALRWALERLQLLQKLKDEAQTRAVESERRASVAEEAHRALEASVETRVRGAEERALHVAKQAQARLEQREKSLSERQAQFDQWWQQMRLQWEGDIRAVRDQLEAQALFKARSAELKQSALEQSHEALKQEVESWKKRALEAEGRLKRGGEPPAAPDARPAAPPTANWDDAASLSQTARHWQSQAIKGEARLKALKAAWEQERIKLSEQARLWCERATAERDRARAIQERSDQDRARLAQDTQEARLQAMEAQARAKDLESSIADETRRAKAALETRLAELQLAWQRERASLGEEARAWQERFEQAESGAATAAASPTPRVGPAGASLEKLKSELEARETAVSERESQLEAWERALAEEYRRKQTQLEELKSQLLSELSKAAE